MKKISVCFLTAAFVLPAAFMLTGCLPGAKPPYLIEQNVLDYKTPLMGTIVAFNQTIRIERFSVAQAYNSTAMIYKPSPYKIAAYDGDRWRVNPGDMISDFLLRDVRRAGLFQGVFSYRDGENTRFVLEGGLEEFLEIDEQDAGKAVIGLTVTLLDSQAKEITQRIVFQKHYTAEEVMSEQNASALTLCMSKAMAQISERILKDIYLALQAQGK